MWNHGTTCCKDPNLQQQDTDMCGESDMHAVILVLPYVLPFVDFGQAGREDPSRCIRKESSPIGVEECAGCSKTACTYRSLHIRHRLIQIVLPTITGMCKYIHIGWRGTRGRHTRNNREATENCCTRYNVERHASNEPHWATYTSNLARLSNVDYMLHPAT